VLSQFWSSWGPGGVAAVERELRDLAPLAHRVAIVEDPPARPEAAVDCLLGRGATLGSCAFRVTPDELATYSSLQREAKAAGIGYVRTVQWFCARGLSPTVIGTIITYRDQTHITATYARMLAVPFAADVAAATRG
jgi:SGNH domain (fused to AT3 domains)